MIEWREYPRWRREITDSVADKMDERWIQGAQKYGEEFIGEPMSNLEEELVDAIIYAYYVRRRQGYADSLLRQALKRLPATDVVSVKIRQYLDDNLSFRELTDSPLAP